MPVGGSRGVVSAETAARIIASHKSEKSKKSTVSQKSRTSRPAKEHGTTLSARADTFAQAAASSERRTGLKAPSSDNPWPFADLQTKDHYRKYDTGAMIRIAIAITQPKVLAVANFHNTGTGSELHVVGRFLELGYVFEHELFYQEATLVDFRRTKKFVADIAIRPLGQGLVLLPIDGSEFHAKTYAEILDAQSRNRALSRLGRVVVVPDTMCYRAQDLDGFLNAHGVR